MCVWGDAAVHLQAGDGDVGVVQRRFHGLGVVAVSRSFVPRPDHFTHENVHFGAERRGQGGLLRPAAFGEVGVVVGLAQRAFQLRDTVLQKALGVVAKVARRQPFAFQQVDVVGQFRDALFLPEQLLLEDGHDVHFCAESLELAFAGGGGGGGGAMVAVAAAAAVVRRGAAARCKELPVGVLVRVVAAVAGCHRSEL